MGGGEGGGVGGGGGITFRILQQVVYHKDMLHSFKLLTLVFPPLRAARTSVSDISPCEKVYNKPLSQIRKLYLYRVLSSASQ